MINQEIVFIINPIAGKGYSKIETLIENAMRKANLKFLIYFTKRRDHAKEIVLKELDSGKTHFVAVGGDGTVNEIASQLVNSKAVLSIIPIGSGNGLARALNISLKPQEALIKVINKNLKTIDSATINGIPFFCTSGVGFDSYCAEVFDQGTHNRGLANYIKIIIKNYFKYLPLKAKLNQIETEFFSITFANANQFGNNAYIAPEAELDSNYLDCTIINKHPKLVGLQLGYMLMNKTLLGSKYVDYFRAKTYTLEANFNFVVHIDGESVKLGTNVININTLPNSLIVTV